MGPDGNRPASALAAVEELEALLAKARALALEVSDGNDGALALKQYRARRLRDEIFGNHSTLFADPAWDILLDLYAARTRNQSTTVTVACTASCAPFTTALRYLASLEKHRLIRRERDQTDKRKALVEITDTGADLMRAWLAGVYG